MNAPLLKTPLHQSHVDLGARMGAFAGYDMPLFYKDGVIKEHEWTRSHCSLFDVSHMGQVMIEGAGAAKFLERITPSNFQNKPTCKAQYTALLNEAGGIIDDIIVSRITEDSFHVVLNAARKDTDIAWIKSHMPDGVMLYPLKNQALIAIQGRWSERILHEVLDFDPTKLSYMHMVKSQTRYGIPVFISRMGYTGEDGFELSLHADEAADIWQSMLEIGEARPAGLAARDSLRLEMGYPLYGHDIDETTTPLEADIGWIVRKKNQDFIGAQAIAAQLESGITRKRVGIKLTGSGIAREGAEIADAGGAIIGKLTSGGFAPSLKMSIGQGYVPIQYAAPGTKISVIVRGSPIDAEIAPLSFLMPKTSPAKPIKSS